VNINEAINQARALHYDGPHSIHGRKAAVTDLLLDMGVEFARHGPPLGSLTSFSGLDVFYDEAMAADIVDLRHRNGRVLYRLIQRDGQWIRLNLAAFDAAMLDIPFPLRGDIPGMEGPSRW
jgi:hypothetical protein